MNSFDQKKITKNLRILQKALKDDVDFIAKILYEQKVFTSDVWREIHDMRCRLPQLQCGVFINHLLRSGEDSYSKFRTILIDMGHHKIVTSMEKSGHTEINLQWTEDRGKTFVLPDLKLPEKINKQARIEDEIDDNDEKKIYAIEDKTEDFQQLERLATFVLTKLDSKDKNNNFVKFGKELKQKLDQDSNENEDFSGLLKTLNNNNFSLTAESLAH